MNGRLFIDSFRGEVCDLKPGNRSAEDVLAELEKHPRVSTWDMCETPWLRRAIRDLKHLGLIEGQDEPYPWHRYSLTDEGRALLRPNVEGNRPPRTDDGQD